jgi:enediyne biosynthesis protein E4
MARTPGVVLAIAFSALGAAGLGAWFVLGAGSLPPLAHSATREASSIAAAFDPAIPAGVRIEFDDVAESVGVRFRHFDGRVAQQYLMDTTGPGLAWLDYDGDGLFDLFLIQGSSIVGPPPAPPPTSRLYRNEGGGRFRDVTDALGVALVGCGQGAAVGDIDNDGDPDLFVTFYGKPNALYRNEAGRRFVEVAARAGLASPPAGRRGPNWATSAAFLDYDADGFLDLFVCSYVEVDLDNYPVCKTFCSPHEFKASACSLYRNRGDGTFIDVSREAGVDSPEAKALGVVTLDLDDDGRTDIFVANDEMPNFFFRNLGGGRFESRGLIGGCTINSSGSTQAYMGVDADDLDGDGWPDLYATAYARETDTLFLNIGGGQFLDATRGSGLAAPSWYGLAFGTCLLDADADGFLDIFVANGHVDAQVDKLGDPNNTFRQRAQFYRNLGQGRFRDISRRTGPYFQLPRVGRGVGACDYDNDGRMDLAVANSGEPTALLHNLSVTPLHWVRIGLRGTTSNRDALGAKVTLKLADGRRIVRHRKGGGSYLSAGDPRLLVGIGPVTRVDDVEVRWPSGLVELIGPIDAGRSYLIVEGSGRIEQSP